MEGGGIIAFAITTDFGDGAQSSTTTSQTPFDTLVARDMLFAICG